MTSLVRLSKALSGVGIASRRKSDEIIKKGMVKVNNIVILDPWYKVSYDEDIITINNNIINNKVEKIYIALNKPRKFISDLNFKDDRNLARNLIKFDGYIYPVGRLDYDSEGLIFFYERWRFCK